MASAFVPGDDAFKRVVTSSIVWLGLKVILTAQVDTPVTRKLGGGAKIIAGVASLAINRAVRILSPGGSGTALIMRRVQKSLGAPQTGTPVKNSASVAGGTSKNWAKNAPWLQHETRQTKRIDNARS